MSGFEPRKRPFARQSRGRLALVGKAYAALRTGGPSGLFEEVAQYLRWWFAKKEVETAGFLVLFRIKWGFEWTFGWLISRVKGPGGAEQEEERRRLGEAVNASHGTGDWPPLLESLGSSAQARSLLESTINDSRPDFRQAAAHFMRATGHNIWWNPACELVSVPCNLCGGDRPRVLFLRWGLPVVRCRKCGLVYVNPRPAPESAKDRYTEAYFKTEYVPSIPLGQHGEGSLDYHHERLVPMRPYKRAGRILDVGCATGFFLAGAREDGWTPYGVEISPYAIEYGQRELGMENLSTSLNGFTEGFFDAITLWETVEHLDDPLGCLQQVYPLLRPGGVLAVSTPNLDSLCYRLIGGKWWPIMPFEHLYYFTPRTLKKMLSRAGFKEKALGFENFDVGRGLSLSGQSDHAEVLFWRLGPERLERLAGRFHGGGTLVLYAEKPSAS